MAELFSTAFANLMTGTNIFLMLVGVVVGIIFGCVPGLSAAMAIALFLPVTFGLPQYSAFALLMALYIGGVSGSLISAILINVPGSSQSIATCYDGHPMAVKGEAHRALGTGMLFSFIGTMFSLVILIFAAPVIADYAVKLGNFEFFSLVTFALVLIICICGGNIVKAILAAAGYGHHLCGYRSGGQHPPFYFRHRLPHGRLYFVAHGHRHVCRDYHHGAGRQAHRNRNRGQAPL